jgi:hypothetical protein
MNMRSIYHTLLLPSRCSQFNVSKALPRLYRLEEGGVSNLMVPVDGFISTSVKRQSNVTSTPTVQKNTLEITFVQESVFTI